MCIYAKPPSFHQTCNTHAEVTGRERLPVKPAGGLCIFAVTFSGKSAGKVMGEKELDCPAIFWAVRVQFLEGWKRICWSAKEACNQASPNSEFAKKNAVENRLRIFAIKIRALDNYGNYCTFSMSLDSDNTLQVSGEECNTCCNTAPTVFHAIRRVQSKPRSHTIIHVQRLLGGSNTVQYHTKIIRWKQGRACSGLWRTCCLLSELNQIALLCLLYFSLDISLVKLSTS